MKQALIFIIILIGMIQGKAQNNDSIPAGPVVDIETNMGPIKVKLYDDTPLHRDNFLKLAKEGFYDGVLFHRVIKDFMVQAGDPSSKNAESGAMLGAGDPGYTLEAEIDYPKHFHKYGALAAARTGDNVNPEKRSSGSQFYIVTGQKYTESQLKSMAEQMSYNARQAYFRDLVNKNRDKIDALQVAGNKESLEELRQEMIKETEENVKSEMSPEIIREYVEKGGTPHLDGQYTVFGEVLEGMDTVEKIQNVATGRADRPQEDIKILNVRVE